MRSAGIGAAVILALAAFARIARPQTGTLNEGAFEFALPMGARSMGMGQAAVATAIGIDALSWNPALIARGPREVGGQFTQQEADRQGSDLSISGIYPIRRLGAFAIWYRYLNEGEEHATMPTGGQGDFITTGSIIGFTFAPTLTDRLVGGLTYKLLRLSIDCTGDCGVLTGGASPTTFAVDLGGAFRVTSDSLIVVGVALRNIGPSFQVNDSPQSDQIPSRADVGIAVTPRVPRWPEGRVRVSADMVTRLSAGGGPGFRLGAEVSFRDRVALRTGYIKDGPPGDGSGPTVGLGVSTGKLQIDFAQVVTDISGGAKPTYLTLRYIF